MSSSSTKKHQEVLDSWEDDDEENVQEEPSGTLSTPKVVSSQSGANGTSQVTQDMDFFPLDPHGYAADTTSNSESRREYARPEKTDAVAKRLIAGALGVRVPKKTEEQRAYDRAIREKEMKRRNMEKEAMAKAKEEAEKQKAAIWDD